MLKNLFFTLFLFYSFSSSGQLAETLQFEASTHNFGTIQEAAGPVVHEFKFINNGRDSLLITGVHASCGCTTPDWTKKPVAPGDSGFVKASYDTYNRPGFFNKSITVHTNKKGVSAKLFIKGNVVPKAKSPQEELTAAFGKLRTRFRVFNMGKVFTDGNPAIKSFEIFNAGDENIIINEVKKPDHVQVKYPDTLKAGELNFLEVAYDVEKKNDLGFFSESITMFTNDAVDSVKSITLFTNIEEYFPPMSREEFEMTPRISLGEQVYDFDKVKAGEVVTTTYEVVNNGLSVLNIRKLDTNCSCLKAELKKNDLAPGESTLIEVALNTENRRGNQQKAITVYSNDPTSPVQRLTIKGRVEVN